MRASAAIIFGLPEAEADAPARHVVALRHREDLDRHFLRALHLQNAGRLVAIEAEVGIGEIVDDHGVVLARQAHDVSKKSRSTHVVVGLCGNEIRIIFGLRDEVR